MGKCFSISMSGPTRPENQQEQITDEKEKPKAGDLIEISRGSYAHWAIGTGDDDVVHLVTDEGGVVQKEKLTKVVGNDPWRINNDLDKKYKPKEDKSIVQEAFDRVGEKLPYNLLSNNCEHFAKELRYGKAESSQVRKAAKGAAGAAVIVAVSGISRLIKTDSEPPEQAMPSPKK